MKKMFALILAMLLIMTCFTACGASSSSDLKAIQKAGKIVVGITDYAPMDYKDENGEWTGFDAEFAQMFADELGVKCEFFVIADWGKKFLELETKQIDAVWNGMTITEEAKLNASVSNPYVINAQVVVMKADAVANYADAASLVDLAVAVENGSAGQDAATEAGVKNIVLVQDQAAALMEVAAGTSDACVIDITMANAMTGEGTSYADLASGLALTSEEYGVAFRKESDLTATFNKFMELETQQVDAIWNGMTITEEAQLNSSVSDPYVINAQVVVMKADKIEQYADVESMKDLTFAVEEGSAGQSVATEAGLKTVSKQDQAGALMEVAAGAADACVIDITMANAMTGEGTDYADLAKGISLSEEEYGVAFRKDSNLTEKLNDFLAQLKEDGTLQALAEKYELTLAD